MIKIITGWSNQGGSTEALISLTNALNEAGHETKMYGCQDWFLGKCNSAILNARLKIDKSDILITHFINIVRPDCKKVILCCHEKGLFEVGNINQYWDVAVFSNKNHRVYHSKYKGAFEVIPNLKDSNLVSRSKIGLEKVAGIISSFDYNKQIHISIERALADGMKKVLLFGGNSHGNPYYDKFILPLLSEKVIDVGFVENKQEMYDSIGCVYASSISEVASLVKQECEQTGTIYHGNQNCEYEVSSLSNKDIIQKWIDLIQK